MRAAMLAAGLEHPTLEVAHRQRRDLVVRAVDRLERLACPKPPSAAEVAISNAPHKLPHRAVDIDDLGGNDQHRNLGKASEHTAPLPVRQLGIDSVEEMQVCFERAFGE